MTGKDYAEKKWSEISPENQSALLWASPHAYAAFIEAWESAFNDGKREGYLEGGSDRDRKEWEQYVRDYPTKAKEEPSSSDYGEGWSGRIDRYLDQVAKAKEANHVHP